MHPCLCKNAKREKPGPLDALLYPLFWLLAGRCRFLVRCQIHIFLLAAHCRVWCHHTKARCLISSSLCDPFDCGKQVYVSVAFQTKFSHPLTSPWTPGSLCVSQQSSAVPPICMCDTRCGQSKPHAAACNVGFLMHKPGSFLTFLMFCVFFCFFADLLSSPTSPFALIPLSPLSPSRPKLSSFLPSHSFLLQLLSLQKMWHSLTTVKPTLTPAVPLFPWPSPP